MSDKNRTYVYKIVSNMLDHPDEYGIYPTTKCYDALERLLNAKDEKHKQALEKLREKCAIYCAIYCQNQIAASNEAVFNEVLKRMVKAIRALPLEE